MTSTIKNNNNDDNDTRFFKDFEIKEVDKVINIIFEKKSISLPIVVLLHVKVDVSNSIQQQ
jgi:hypothetical protein